MSSPTVSIAVIIVNYRTAALTIDCLASLATEFVDNPIFNVVLVDNLSADDSPDVLNRVIVDKDWVSWVDFIQAPRNGGFSYGNNLGIRKALERPEPPAYVLLLNPDTVVLPGAVDSLRAFLDANPRVGIAGSRLEDPDGSTQFAARRFPGIVSEFESAVRFGPISRLFSRWLVTQPDSNQAHPCDWLPGASLMIRKEVIDDIGLLDEEYFMYFEEVDYCYAAKKAGWQVWYVPESRVVHLVGKSSGVTAREGAPKRLPTYWFASRHRFFKKNFGLVSLWLTSTALITGLLLRRIRELIQCRASTLPPRIIRDLLGYELKMLTKTR